ncbi:MAG TPA: TadE family protein [Beijerinckiaceae bacterium]|nr:TadE family protein [Beijerinckiaceae bacterium]
MTRAGLRRAARFRRDAAGGVAISVALLLPVLFGFAVLAVDAGRYFNLHTSVQWAADALALAGAAELDRKPDAIVRAERAIDSLVANDQRFGEGPGRIARDRLAVRYLRSLPTSDATAIGAANLTADPLEARFVEVAVQPVAFRSFFAAAAAVSGGPTEVRASAVAGFDSVACKVMPLFMCNPFEGTSTSIFEAGRDPSFRRRLMTMKEKGVQYFPGNYGYLEAPDGGGASAIRENMANAAPKGCYKLAGVELHTGNVASTAEAINVRFDMYDGNFGGVKSNPAYRPARNVRKGYKGSACNKSQAYDIDKPPNVAPNTTAPSLGFPRDSCFYTDTCSFGSSSMAGRVGGGDWNFEAYWAANFPGIGAPNGWSNANRPSRYDVYRYEIDNNLVDVASRGTSGADKETGVPQCYGGGVNTLNDAPDRRTFTGAILDCKKLDEMYGISGSSAPPLPVTAYARFFLTEPMDKQDGTVWVELVEVIEPGTPAAREIYHETVQLYR